MSAQNGGPAFPCEYVEHERWAVGNQVPIMGNAEGISVRDYFAAKAMQALIAKAASAADWRDLSSVSYATADSMLAERAK